MMVFREVLSTKILASGWKDVAGFQVIPSYPHIPKLGIDPWKLHPNTFAAQCMFHIRTRDYKDLNTLEIFLAMQAKCIGRNHYALLVFGDKHEDEEGGFEPWQAISLTKQFFYKVGVVVNPTPIERTVEQELKTLSQKLKKNPDFVVLQCVYDVEKTMNFLGQANFSYDQLCINLGYWKDDLSFAKLGICNPERLKFPPKQLVDFALHNCNMVYICGNHPIVEKAEFPFYLNDYTSS